MGHGQACKNHPDRTVQGCCHVCHEWLCAECLQEGPLHYYCHKPKCSKALKAEMKTGAKKCPSCNGILQEDPEFCPDCGVRLKPAKDGGKDDLVTVMRFSNSIEAQLAKSKLESEGIEAFVIDEYLASYIPFPVLGGIRLQTAESQAKEAVKILEQRSE